MLSLQNSNNAMQELSLNILDIVQNSVKAGASLIAITVEVSSVEKTMEITVVDDGCGMDEQQLLNVVDPFFTTRTTRKVGLGVPFFKMSAEMTAGSFNIKSKVGEGTKISAFYHTDHIDMVPLGDMAATMLSLVSVNPDIDFTYIYGVDGERFTMDTSEVKTILEGLPVNSPQVLSFIKDFITENEAELNLKI